MTNKVQLYTGLQHHYQPNIFPIDHFKTSNTLLLDTLTVQPKKIRMLTNEQLSRKLKLL